MYFVVVLLSMSWKFFAVFNRRLAIVPIAWLPVPVSPMKVRERKALSHFQRAPPSARSLLCVTAALPGGLFCDLPPTHSIDACFRSGQTNAKRPSVNVRRKQHRIVQLQPQLGVAHAVKQVGSPAAHTSYAFC
jgi:hypothetical protein